MDPAILTRRFIDIPSITGTEAAMATEIEAICAELGWSTQREHLTADRWNLYVNWEAFAPVVFCTHLDTVPPHYPSRMDEEFIHGRGACDTKGIIAGMLCAGELLAGRGARPSFLFVVGEETGSEGAKLAARSDRRADYIIVGEPTENRLAAGHKGALSYTLRTTGVSVHSSLPGKGVSAIENLLALLGDIMRIPWDAHPVLGGTTTSITMIGGGEAINIIPADAWAKVFHRITLPLADARETIRQCVGERGSLDFHSMTDPQELVVVDGYPTTVVAFGTDVPYLRAMGKPLLIGPGAIEDTHTMTEKISLQQLRASVRIFANLYHTLVEMSHCST